MARDPALNFMDGKNSEGITLLELLIAIILMSLIVLGLTNINIFSRQNILSTEYRNLIQNELSAALEHMNKSIFQATGDISNPAIQAIAGGFEVRVDPNNTIPPVFSNDLWYQYTLSGNTLTFQCVQISGGSPTCLPDKILSNHIIPGFANGTMPANNPTNGFYFSQPNSTTVVVGLAARYTPSLAIGVLNPQIQMTASMSARSASAN